MKKKMITILFTSMFAMATVSGCGNSETISVETNTPETASVETPEVEETQTTTQAAESTEASTETQTISEEQTSFVYNDFLTEYQNDLGRIRIYESEASEFVEHEDVLELKNAVASRDYYLDAEIVENAKAGDTITIQDVPYTLKTIEKCDGNDAYSVELSSDVEADWENGIYVYEDIYMFSPSADGKNYSIIFCSDDTIAEQIYTGSVYIAKDAVINTYVGDTVKDITVSEYFATDEYPYISTWGFELNEEGLISFIQNQIAG